MKVFFRILLLVSFIFMSFNITQAGFLSDLFEDSQPQVHYCQKGDDCGLNQGIESLKGKFGDDIVTDRSFSTYAQDIVKFLLGFVYLVAVAFIVYAGFNLLTGAGDEEKAKKSKGMIIYVVIGILIIFLAGPITQFILNVLNVTPTTA